jgi:hypothetical protein
MKIKVNMKATLEFNLPEDNEEFNGILTENKIEL